VQTSAEFATFMHAYQDMVFSTAARLTGNDSQAEDIAQEVFLRAYENFPQLRASPTAGGWLKTVATRLTLNHLSRYRRRWRFFSELRNDDSDDEPDVELADLTSDSIIADIDADKRHALVELALRGVAGPSSRATRSVSLRGDALPGDREAPWDFASEGEDGYPARSGGAREDTGAQRRAAQCGGVSGS
jgi:hypothetical protein